MSIAGVDTTAHVTSTLSMLKREGCSFVCRYYSNAKNAKRMTAAESDAIARAGLKRVVVYQNVHQSYGAFTTSRASKEAEDAIHQAKALGQPSSTIYFAVDYDANASEIDGNITEYFKVVKSTLASAGYSTGVYGSSLVCRTLKEAGLVTKTWLSMSTAWGHGTAFSDWNIKQTTEITLGGVQFDKDVASSIDDIGAW